MPCNGNARGNKLKVLDVQAQARYVRPKSNASLASITMNYVLSDLFRKNFQLVSLVFCALLFEHSHFTDFLTLVSVFQNSKYSVHVLGMGVFRLCGQNRFQHI